MERDYPFIPRTLVQQDRFNSQVNDNEIDPSEAPIVILGEAGMGKSRLLTKLASQAGWNIVQADTIELADNSASTVWLIDALDEITGVTAENGLKTVLQELKKNNCPSFIISCRTSSWLYAKYAKWIHAVYEKEPIVLHLQPFNEEGVHAFLCAYLNAEQIIKLHSHLERFGLTRWLGNPHTLKLIAESAVHGKLPRNRSEMFQHAVEQLVSEHNDLKKNNAFALKDAFELAGAVCATLLLTGYTAISLVKPTRVTDFPLVELKRLPNGNRIQDLLETRLFRALDTNRFECIHRSIAEYLAAHWLVQEPLSRRTQRRLLEVFHHYGVVPSNLRGIHAWLCMSSILAQRVICMDPVGVIENADLAGLTPELATLLLKQLEECYSSNPMALSWWRPGTAAELANKGLVEKLVNIGIDRSKPEHLRLLILESLEATAELKPFKKILLNIIFDKTDVYAARRAALQALFDLLSKKEFFEYIRTLYEHADFDSVRLAFDLTCLGNFNGVEDKLLAILIISCSHQNERFGELDKFAPLKSDLPLSRLASLLNCLIEQLPIGPLSPDFFNQQTQEFHEVLISLTIKAIKGNTLSPAQAWRVFCFLCSGPFYTSLDLSILEHLAADFTFRHAVQQYVMFDCPGAESLEERYNQLREVGIYWSENDLIAMFTRLDANDLQDERWKGLVSLWHHDKEYGVKLRSAALQFAGNNRQRRAWASNIELNFSRQTRQEQFQREDQRREEQNRHNAKAELDEHKLAMIAISQGEHRYLIIPARKYLYGSCHINNAGGGHTAVIQWAGGELATAVFEGFDNYLLNIQIQLSSEEISQYFARLSQYESNARTIVELSVEIILAAAIEHMRIRGSLDCLSDKALFAIFLSTNQITSKAPDTLKILVYKTLGERNLLMEAVKLWFEPGIFSGENIPQIFLDIPELYIQTNEILTRLIINWLECQPELPEDSVYWCLQHLANNEPNALIGVVQHWDTKNFRPMPLCIEAVQLIVNFKEMSALLNSTTVNSELLLALNEFKMLTPSVEATIWIIEKFRNLYPKRNWLKGNLIDEGWPTQQSEYIQLLIFQPSEQQTPEAQSAMNLLCEATRDSYTDYLFERRALQCQNNKGQAYRPLTFEALMAIKHDEPPHTGADLLAFMLEQLDIVQLRIKNDELNSWKLFYKDDGNTPQEEECCRDRLIGMLENTVEHIRFVPESRVVDQKRVDIMCETMDFNLPIEIKGFWNRQLWSAADQQLNEGYVSFHKSSGLGIYLVLWFGELSKKPPRPADKKPLPSSPEQLKTMIEERSEAVKTGSVKVVVMDMTRSD
ncbi:NACHT domain-containing protein [Providencia alcalifaciens]|uniref:NACHT domain-containing protein n=1 Tax=Providencia alcalifaciens TaxID=126385 RepID=UPI003D98AAC0